MGVELKLREKIKVLQFPIANSKGGITQYVLQNWQFIDKTKIQFDFATMSKSLSFASDLEKDGCNIFYISCYAEDDENQFVKEFREILKNGKYDVIHLHTKQWKSFLVEKLAREAGIKRIIVHAHSTGIDTSDPEKRKKEEALHQRRRNELTEDIATDYWACSRLTAEFLYDGKISADKIKIMPNAIDVKRFNFNRLTRMEVRKELKVDGEILIGHVGRFEYPKNHEFLVSVFSKVCQKNKNVKLLLVGTGKKKNVIMEMIRELGIENRTIVTGYRDDVNRLMQAMDIFCFPSQFEGLGISLIEAQAADLEILCSDKIPEEVQILERVHRIPLDENIWVEAIENLCVSYERVSRKNEMRTSGYDIYTQIQYIEREYGGI